MKLQENTSLYTKEIDGTVEHWFVYSLCGFDFAVTRTRNAKRSAYRRYYSIDDIGKTIFQSRTDAIHAPVTRT